MLDEEKQQLVEIPVVQVCHMWHFTVALRPKADFQIQGEIVCYFIVSLHTTVHSMYFLSSS